MKRENIDMLLLVGLIVILSVVALVVGQQRSHIADLEHRMDELNCVIVISEDGMGRFADDELSQDCLKDQLGWPLVTYGAADEPGLSERLAWVEKELAELQSASG